MILSQVWKLLDNTSGMVALCYIMQQMLCCCVPLWEVWCFCYSCLLVLGLPNVPIWINLVTSSSGASVDCVISVWVIFGIHVLCLSDGKSHVMVLAFGYDPVLHRSWFSLELWSQCQEYWRTTACYLVLSWSWRKESTFCAWGNHLLKIFPQKLVQGNKGIWPVFLLVCLA